MVDPGSGNDLPRLVVLQAVSPQLKKGGESYLHEAKVGDFGLVGSDVGDVFPDGVAVIPFFHRTEHVHWGKDRGGLIKNYLDDDSILTKCRREGYNYFLPNGDEVVQTSTWYLLAADPDEVRSGGEPEWIVAYFPLKHAGWKEHKAWRKMIDAEPQVAIEGGRLWKPTALFWRVWMLKPASRSNRKKQEWESWTAEPGPTLLELDPSGGTGRRGPPSGLQIDFENERRTKWGYPRPPRLSGGLP